MITLNRPSILLLIPLLSLSAVPAIAAPAQQEQLDQSRAQEAERQERLGEERVETIIPPPPSADLPADESVRFHISQITIENQVERFRFLERIARSYKDKDLSLSDILAEDHTPVQIGISIKDGVLGHAGIVVKTDTGSYDSADYGRYGEDVEKSSSGLEAPTGHGTFITRWFYNPDEKYTFMINPEYIDPVKAVAAYNDQIKNHGYTQIPMEQTANFFQEVRPKDGNSEEVKEQNEHAKEINANTQYYRNGTSDYHLTAHNCVTTTIIPILQSISYDNLSWEAKITVRQLRENLFNPRAIYTILSDDIYFFQGKGLLTNGAYGRVPSE